MGDYREISFPPQNMHSCVINYQRRAHNLLRPNKQDRLLGVSTEQAAASAKSEEGRGGKGRGKNASLRQTQPDIAIGDTRSRYSTQAAVRRANRPVIVKIGLLMPPISARIKDGHILELMESLSEPGKEAGLIGSV